MSITREDLGLIQGLRANVESVIIGKSEIIKLCIASLLARGHLLIEDIPGIGKTALVRALARSVSCSFKRIQFTPDLLPGDVTGISIFDQEKRDFVFKPGPIFANIILGDEINRATPDAVRAARGHERVPGHHRRYDPSPSDAVPGHRDQNPLEFTGPIPCRVAARPVLMVLKMGYPSPEEERRILASRRGEDPVDKLQPVVTSEQVVRLGEKVREVRVDDSLTGYIVDLVNRTRTEKTLIAGVSPRGAIHLSRAPRRTRCWTDATTRRRTT